MKTSSNWMDKSQGKYFLYAENLFFGNKGHYRYFDTIKEALEHIADITISWQYAWRLIRTTDEKNFTNKIYQ